MRGNRSQRKAPYDEDHVNAMMKDRFAWTFYELYNPGKFSLQTSSQPNCKGDPPREDNFDTPLASYSLEEELKLIYAYENEGLEAIDSRFQNMLIEMERPENNVALEFIPLNYKSHKQKSAFDSSREEWNKKLQETADKRASLAKSEKELLNHRKRSSKRVDYINQQREKRISHK